MRYYKYRLTDFLNEVQQDFADTKQFYDGDSDTGEQAGKPGNADFNSKAIADNIAIAAKVFADARAAVKTIKKNTEVSKKVDLSDLTNPTAAGKISYKSAGLSGVIDVKGNLDANFKIKLGDPSRYFSAKLSGNVSDLEDIYNNPFSLTFVDKEGKKNNFDIEINPEKNYSFSYNKSGNTLGEKGENTGQFNFGFNVNVPKDASKSSAGLSAQFNSNDNKSYSAAIDYGGAGTKVTLGFAKPIGGTDAIDLLGGTGSTATLNTSVYAQVGQEKDAGVRAQLTVTGKNPKKTQKSKNTIDKIAPKVMKKAATYGDFATPTKIGGFKTTTVTDEEGNKKDIPTIQKDVQDVKDDIENAAEKLKINKENKVIITKKKLKILIEKLIKI